MDNRERFQIVGTLFHEARHLQPVDQEAFLRQRCPDDSGIRREVLHLLGKDQQDGLSVDRPLVDVNAALEALGANAETSPEHVPATVGSYRIIGLLGHGGMGTVYEAEQENPRRRVAIKAIRRGIHSRAMVRRFQQEAQILGRLQHPCIAQILEAGSAEFDGDVVPFLAMELVRGRPLLNFASHHALDIRARLELLVQICDAVQHAHEHNVIHRDLKPGNILVICGDAPGSRLDRVASRETHHVTSASSPLLAQPKILDFGVARATDCDVQAVTLQTTEGQLIGTVPYMSPEQAAGDPSQVDWRTDVYALGVIAFELLSGRLPHDVRDKLAHEAIRVIRENEPSRLGSVDRSLRGDLETILDKALAHEKDRRYQSAAALAADIRRYLRDEPITARPPSAIYQLRKFARRNKALVTGVAIAFGAMLVATAFSVRLAIVAERARVEEQRLRSIADERTAEAQRQSYRSSLVAASSALRSHDVADAQRLLNSTRPELRGWESAHLSSRIDDSLMRLQISYVPMDIAISPDGRTLVASNSGGKVQTWSLPEFARGLAGVGRDGALVPEDTTSIVLQGELNVRRILDLEFSGDGSEVLAHARNRSYRLDADSLEQRGTTDYSRRAIPTHDTLTLVSGPSSADIVDTETGETLVVVKGANKHGVTAAFSPCGQFIAVCFLEQDGLTIHRIADGETVCSRPDLKHVSQMSFSPDSTRAAVASYGGRSAIIEVIGGRTVRELSGSSAASSRIAFSPDGRLIASVSMDRTVCIWRADDGALLSLMHGNQASVNAMIWSPDGRLVITGCADGAIRWWDATSGAHPFVLPASHTVYGVAFSPDGSLLASVALGGERSLRVWDVRTGLERLAISAGELSAIAFSRDGSRLAVGRSRGEASTVFDLEGNRIATAPGHHWRTDWVGFGSGTDQLLSLGNGGPLVLSNLVTDDHRRLLTVQSGTEQHGCRAAFSPDGSLFAINDGADIKLLDTATWSEPAILHGHTGRIHALAFSSDGARLVSGSSDRALRVWDVARGECIATLTGHSDVIFAAAFSPDGRRIVSGGRDRVVRVWDVERFEEITQFHGHTSFIYCMAFSPDGQTLATGGGDDTVRLWSTRPWREYVGVP